MEARAGPEPRWRVSVPAAAARRDASAKPPFRQQPRAAGHLSAGFPTALPFAALRPKTRKKTTNAVSPLTSPAAAISRIYFSAIYFESPTPRDVNVGRFFDIDYVWGSGARDAKEVGDISAVEASLKQREGTFHQTSSLWESVAAFPRCSAPRQ